MVKKILIILVSIFMSACVSTKNIRIDTDSSALMAGKTMAVSTSDRPDFAAMTAGKASFGMIGSFAMISAGNKIIKKNGIEDPASFIASELARDISEIYSLSVTLPIGAGNNNDIEYLVKAYSENNYILDVRTINWSFVYFPTDWNNYRVIYSAKLRLIDVATKKVIAEAFCARVPEKSSDSPSRDQLLSNNAARLKEELREAADYCIKDVRKKLL